MERSLPGPTMISGQHLILSFRDEKRLVPLEQIIRLEADSNYTYIYLDNQRKLIMAKVLCAYELMLAPFGFVRVHRSHLVNSLYIRSVETMGEVEMIDHTKVEVSRRKRKIVRDLFGQRLPLSASGGTWPGSLSAAS